MIPSLAGPNRDLSQQVSEGVAKHLLLIDICAEQLQLLHTGIPQLLLLCFGCAGDEGELVSAHQGEPAPLVVIHVAKQAPDALRAATGGVH